MNLITMKPTSPGRRNQTPRLIKMPSNPPRSLIAGRLNKVTGRNSWGRITTRHRGGGEKRMFRIIDWKRNKLNIPATVMAIEYDPNRSAYITLLNYADGE